MLTLAGWLLAALGSSFALVFWQRHADRLDAVARACHELRGPITAARLGLQLGARTGGLTRERLRAIELELGRAGLALEELSGVRSAWREEVDVRQLLGDSVEAWRPAAAAAGIRIMLTWSGAPAFVLGERLRLAQATGNLLANAIEHGATDVHVRARTERGAIRVEVRDSGPGLSAPLTELGGSRWGRWTHNPGPRGHGLAVARAIAAAHGGRIAAAPSEQGARLVLELPVARSGRAELPAG